MSQNLDSLENTYWNTQDLSKKTGKLIELAYTHFRGDVDKGYDILRKIRSSVPKDKQGAYQMAWSEYFRMKGNIANGLKSVDSSLAIYTAQDHSKGIGKALVQKSLFLSAQGDHNEVLKLLDQALIHLREAGDEYGQIRALNIIGNRYSSQAKFLAGLENYQMALDLATRTGTEVYIPVIHTNLANLHYRQQNYEQAKSSFKKVIELYESSRYDYGKALALMGLSECYVETNLLDSAMMTMTKADQICASIGSFKLQAENDFRVANVLRLQGKKESARFRMSELHNKIDSLQDSGLKGQIKILYGHLLIEKDQSNMVRELFLDGLELVSLPEDKVSAYEGLGFWHISKKQMSIGLAFSDSARQIRKDLISDRNARLISEWQEKYESAIKEATIASLEEDKRLSEIRFYTMLGAFITLVILGVLVYYVIRQKNNALKLEIENQNQKLANTTMTVINQNNLIKNISQKVEEFTKNKPVITGNEINQLKRQIGKTHLRRRTKEWEQFSEQFDKVHNEFSTRFLKTHPDLSTGELRICQMIKLNLDSRQIADALSISHKSLLTMRSRIRKKMNLESEDDLSKVIIQF